MVSRRQGRYQRRNTMEATPKPNTQERYEYYRSQGFSQKDANAKAIQDVINWGVANGHLDSKWAKK